MNKSGTAPDRLTTDRLRLRPFEEKDYPTALRIASDRKTIRYLFFWGRDGIKPAADARRFLDYAVKSWKEEPIRAREYCACLLSTDEPVGECCVEWVEDSPGTAEIGWILLPEYRKQGYATEMGRKMAALAFDEMNAECVIAHCDDRNAPSYHVMERLGMRLLEIEKGARPAKRFWQKNGDERTYVLLREEWRTTREECGSRESHEKG